MHPTIANTGTLPIALPQPEEPPAQSVWLGRRIFIAVIGFLAATAAIVVTIFLAMKLSKKEVEAIPKQKDEEEENQIYEFFTHHFQSSNPAVPFTLFDSKDFLELRLKALFSEEKLSPQKLRPLEKIHANMAKYYDNIRMKDEFENLDYEFKRNLAFSEIKIPGILANKFYKTLCMEVLEKIEQKIDAEPSISSHPIQLLSKDEFQFLTDLNGLKDPQFENRIAKIDRKIDQEINKVNASLNKYSELFSKLTKSYNTELVVQAKKALLALHLDIGRKFVLTDLAENDRLLKDNQVGLTSLLAYQNKRGPEIDLGVLQELKEEHDKAASHPIVGIEGGGPTGLLLAITQYQTGSNILLFEKRSTQYDRTQVVRLDPNWMAMLEFYLGETYYQLFIDKGHKAILRKDGFGEIVTRDLEESLHNKLTELISWQNGGSIERLGAHEVKDVIKPQEPRGKFKLVVDYIANQDRGFVSKSKVTETRDIDYLICAGGKSSSMREIFMPCSVPVNGARYYGICSWLSKNFKAQDPEKMDLFQDFRGMIHLNEKFISDFENRISKKISELQDLITLPIVRGEWLERPFLQTRTFENKGLIYIGMELPEVFNQFLAEIRSKSNLSKEKLNEIVKTIQTTWFDLVGEYYSLESSLKIDRNFVSTFTVDQQRLPKEHSYCKIEADGAQLFVTAAGDAFASPHFMRYSGLTGARENILHLQRYMKDHIGQNQTEEALLKILTENGDKIAKHVIDRGSPFLTALTQESILKSRKAAMKKSLETAALNWKDKNSSMSKISDDVFLLQQGRTNYVIQVKEDHLLVNGHIFNSIKHFLLSESMDSKLSR